MNRKALVDAILAEQLFNPISGYDVEAEDVFAYLDETGTGSVDGFKAWLAA